MSGEDLDARLRRHFAGIDTAPDFEARVAARVATLPAVAVADLKLRCERSQYEIEARLRRDAWLNAATAAGVGAAAIALVWRNAAAVAASVHGAFDTLAQTGSATLVIAAVVAAALWPLIQRP